MPDNTESVVYEYRGDVTSLRKATEQAINFLDNYQKHINRISSDGGFGKNVKTAKSFQTAVKSVTKDITAMQAKLKSVSDVKLMPNSDVQKQITASLGGLSQVQSKLQASTKLTTKEVQALTLQLRNSKQSLQSSSAGVDNLIAKEVKFQQTLETVRTKVSNFRDSLDSIKTRVSGAFDPLISKLNSLRNPFARIVQTVQTFKDKAASSFGRLSQVASTVASAFRRVSNSEDAANNAANRATRSHTSLSSILKRLRGQFTEETKAIQNEEKSLKKKDTTIKSTKKSHNSLGATILSLTSFLSRETNSLIGMNTHLGNLAKRSNLATRALRSLVGVNLGRWLTSSVKQSISYVENMNLFKVATGEAYEESLNFVDSMAELYGMDPNNLLRYAGNFYQLADAISMPSQASAALSLGLTKATTDIASLFNVDVETVFENLSSGMQGMARAVRKYGMDIRTTTLQQTALTLGITEQVENMSEANRQGLRFITMMRQASNASGDFARTIEAPANQLRVFKEQITQLGRAIGNFLIKPIANAIVYINGFVMALRTILQFIGTLTGAITSLFGDSNATDGLDETTDGITSMGNAAEDTTKKLKKLLAPFDELNVLQDSTSSSDDSGLSDLGELDPAILKAIEEMQWQLDKVEMKAVKVRNAILAFLGFKVEDGTILSWDANVLEENLLDKFPQWSKTIKAVFDNWTSIIEGFKKVFKSIGAVFQKVWDKILNFIQKFVNDDSASDFINNLSTYLENLANWIDKNSDKLANFAIALGILKVLKPLISLIFKAGQGILSLSQSASSSGAALSSISGTMLGWIAVIAVAIVALVDLYNTVDSFREKVSNTVRDVAQTISTLWNNLLKPVLSSLIDTIISIYEDTLKPVVSQLASLIMSLLSDILLPLLNWLIKGLGPSIVDIVKYILGVVEWVFNNIGGILRGLMQLIQGVIDFITGAFTGDWKKAWEGIVDIFAGIFNTIVSVIVTILNVGITIINGALSVIYNAVVAVINLVLEAINSVGESLGFTLELGINAKAPQIGYIQAPKIAMASGGVVTSPTNALIGEGHYDEAVVPLGNSPQMREFADSVADRVNSGEQIKVLREQNDLLRQILAKTGTYLDGRLVSDMVTKHQQLSNRALGV